MSEKPSAAAATKIFEKNLGRKILTEKISADKIFAEKNWPNNFCRDENGGREGREALLLFFNNHQGEKKNTQKKKNGRTVRPNGFSDTRIREAGCRGGAPLVHFLDPPVRRPPNSRW